jgi:hypothetical protein
LFESFAQYDAAAALRLAETIGLNLANDAPWVLVACAKSDVFLDIIISRLQDDAKDDAEDDAKLLAALLALGGLSNNHLASHLIERPAEEALKVALGAGGLADSWRGLKAVAVDGKLDRRSSLYSQCLGVLVDADLSATSMTLPAVVQKRLALLRALKPSGRVVKEPILEGSFWGLVLGALAVGSAVVIIDLKLWPFLSVAVIALFAVVLIVLYTWLMSAYCRLRRSIYSYAVGLEYAFSSPRRPTRWNRLTMPWLPFTLTRRNVVTLLTGDLPSGPVELEFLEAIHSHSTALRTGRTRPRADNDSP